MQSNHRKSFLITVLALGWTTALAWSAMLAPRPGGLASGEDVHHFPIIRNAPFTKVKLTQAWTQDAAGSPQVAYQPGDALTHRLSGTNLTSAPLTATLHIEEAGPCGAGLVFSDTVVLPPGPWQHSVQGFAPNCTGAYTAVSAVYYDTLSPTKTTSYVVNLPVQTPLSQAQGFDRCAPASVPQMQTWWDQSPYAVVNLYIGGIHYACANSGLDAFWVRAVADQGWAFTAIWVGPQAPCTGYTHRISANPTTAYTQGQQEAAAAAEAARKLGLFGPMPLLYDVEGFSGADTACRSAVQAFIQGWTDRLHEAGYTAGAYGSPCSSYIADWHANNPRPDQVWIAHWTDPGYNPNASVWNVPCGVTNTMWANHQRLKQYAGGHNETWGGVTMNIDSNVFDATVIGWGAGGAPAGIPAAPIRGFGPTGPTTGWVLSGGHLYRSANGLSGWIDITPADHTPIAAAFLDDSMGWTVAQDAQGGLFVGRTEDGGAAWTFTPLVPPQQLAASQVARAFIDYVDADHVWVAIRLVSGSSFSQGRLFASSDGGRAWSPRAHPLGEAVEFISALEGWTYGGPDGTQAFTTVDGGRTWSPALQPLPLEQTKAAPAAPGRAGVIEIEVWSGSVAWALVQEGSCTGPKNAQTCTFSEVLLATTDRGATWTPIPLP